MRSNHEPQCGIRRALLCLVLGVLPTVELLHAQGGHGVPTQPQAPPRAEAPGQKSPPNGTSGPPAWRPGP